ncbi:MAG: AzlC family ABC transporter permease [Alphaproteobacteria bacterium]|nr:AzlC family ABC transporter permease [Alphaproteobacteria bacterium]
MPIAFGGFGYGIAFGVLAADIGLSWLEAVLMSALIFAGASQLVALQMWTNPPAAIALALATAVVNARHLLYGAAIHPWFRRLRWFQSYPSLFFMADGTWALTLEALRNNRGNGAFLLGAGLLTYIEWVVSTGVGHALGKAVGAPQALGLDFMLAAFMSALMVALWRGRADVAPAAAAIIVAYITHSFAGAQWHIIAGGVAGALVGAWRHVD